MSTDAELLRAWTTESDREALNDLVRTHYGASLDLARRLDRDRHLAEDAVQDAFMNLMRSAGSWRGEGSVRAWLYRLVVNAVRTRQRKRGRRAGYESAKAQQAPRSSATPDVAAMHAEVRAQVDALPEDQQVPVVLHYFRGLSHAEIGAVTGAPAGTVTSRIRAAKSRLASVLTGLAALTLSVEEALAQLDASPPPPPAPFLRLMRAMDGGSAATGAGLGAALTRWLTPRLATGILTGLVIAGAAWGTWAITSDPTGSQGTALGGPDALDTGTAIRNRGQATAEPGNGAGSQPAAFTPPEQPAGGTTAPGAGPPLRGDEQIGLAGRGAVGFRVVDHTGRPIAGATARVAWEPDFPIGPARGQEPDPREPVATTDESGRAQLFVEFPYLKNRYSTYVWIRAAGYTPRRIDRLRIEAGRVTEAGDVVLQPGRVVHGRVVDADGKPVPDAVVWTSNREHLPNNRVDDDWGSIRFWHLDFRGVPDRAVRTGTNGEFRVSGAAAPATTVYVQADGFVDAKQAVTGDGEQAVTVQLSSSIPVHGVVRSETGDTVPAGVVVSCTVTHGPHRTTRRGLTIADGSFAIEGLPAGQGTLLVTDPEWGVRTITPMTVRAGAPGVELIAHRTSPEFRDPRPEDGVLDLGESDATAEGVVVFAESGLPVPEYEVVLWQRARPGHELESNNIGSMRVRRPDGRFVVKIQSDPKARTLLLIRARGTATRRVAVTVAAGDHLRNLRVELRSSGAGLHLRGIVRDRESREPLAGVELRPLMQMSPHVPGRWTGAFAPAPHPLLTRVVSGPDGRFELRWVGDAIVHLVAVGDAVGASRTVAQNARVADGEIEIPLRRRAGIRGGVVDAAGSPRDNLEVSLHRYDSEWDQRVRTDHRGTFAFGSLRPGRYVVCVWTPEPRRQRPMPWMPDVVRVVEIEESALHRLDLALPEQAGAITGTVVRPDGYEGPLTVRLETEAGVSAVARLRANDARFEFPHVPAARFTLRLSPSGGGWTNWDHDPFELATGEHLALPAIRLDSGAQTQVTIVLPGGATAGAGVSVTCTQEGRDAVTGRRRRSANASTNAAGAATFHGLPAGPVEIYARDPKSGKSFKGRLETLAGTTAYRVTLAPR